jgi:hypothetical protein
MFCEELFERVQIVDIDDVQHGGRRYGANRAVRVKIFINPLPTVLARLAETSTHRIRFLLDQAGDVYVWNHADALHFDIQHAAGIDELFSGYVKPGEITVRTDEHIHDLAPLIRANPHIIDMMGGANFKIKRETLDLDY